MAWLMTSLTTSPVLIAMVPFATLAPVFFFGMIGGAMADAVDRRKWLIGTQTAMMLAACAMGASAVSGTATPALLLGLTFVLGVASSLNIPAWQAIVQELVPREQVASAVSLNSMSFNTARMLGPVAGGIAVGVWGPSPVFFFNAVSYLAVIVALASWEGEGRTTRAPGVFRGLVEGMGYLLGASYLRGSFARVAAICFCSGPVMALLPALARERLGLDAGHYGMLLGVFGAGALCGGGSVPFLRRFFSPGHIVGSASLLVAAAIAAIGVAPVIAVCIPAMFALGYGWIACMVNLNVSVQTSVPAEYRGRAMALYFTIFQGAFALGSLASGFLAKAAGFTPCLLAFAGALFVASFFLFGVPMPSAGALGQNRADEKLG